MIPQFVVGIALLAGTLEVVSSAGCCRFRVWSRTQNMDVNFVMQWIKSNPQLLLPSTIQELKP